MSDYDDERQEKKSITAIFLNNKNYNSILPPNNSFIFLNLFTLKNKNNN